MAPSGSETAGKTGSVGSVGTAGNAGSSPSAGGAHSAGSPSSPGSSGSGSPGSAGSTPMAGSGNTPSGGRPSAGTPAPSQGPFARLTRAEYAATVRAAFGVDADVSILPEDGRTGPFTSNSTSTTDPVHPYLLAAEQIATAVVPQRLKACEGSALQTCVRQTFGGPFATLYRRPLTDAEINGAAARLTRLTADGVSAVDATRALVSSALMSPDFMFRAALASGADGAHARRVAERLSYALLDAPPDAALTSAASAAGSMVDFRAQTSRIAEDARAIPVFARFLAQWLHLDLDLRLMDSAFATTPRYVEFLAFVEDALRTDRPVTDLLAGQRGFVHRENADAYGLTLARGNDTVVPVSWPADSPRRGIIAQDLLADSTRHPDKSRRWIFRGRLVRSYLMCMPIPAPSADLIALAGEVSDRLSDARCSSCHRMMDPIGRAFDALDADATGTPQAAEVLSHPELEGTYADLPALLEAVSGSRAYAECFAKHWLSFFLDQNPNEVDAAWIAQLADAVQSGASLRAIAEQSTITLESTARAAVPWCSGS